MRWTFLVSKFDADHPAGRQLNEDLQRYAAATREPAALTMEVRLVGTELTCINRPLPTHGLLFILYLPAVPGALGSQSPPLLILSFISAVYLKYSSLAHFPPGLFPRLIPQQASLLTRCETKVGRKGAGCTMPPSLSAYSLSFTLISCQSYLQL